MRLDHTDLALRVYLACGVACVLLGHVALWWAYGWTFVLVMVGAAVMVMAGVGGWMHAGGPQGGGE